jgi:steroid delta-isomerase-like uncharacterized protein
MDDPRIAIADKLFAAWSSGDLDAPAQYLTADAVLSDIVGGEHQGWPAIRAYFAQGLEKWPDLALVPDQHWVNDTGVALNWVMTATVHDDSHGPEAKGKTWRSEGMSWLVFDGDKVVREVDYHDSAAVTRSVQPEVSTGKFRAVRTTPSAFPT